ncbi:MAG: hypothetical protein ABFD20_06865 [Anaerolineales bacterium]
MPLFRRPKPAPTRHSLAVAPEPDEPLYRPLSTAGAIERPWHAQRAELERIYAACATNPLAARLLALTADFVIGSQATVRGHPFAQRFWAHPLNHLETRVFDWCRELSRSGELFLVLSRNPVDGLSYVREVPALLIDAIEVDPNDRERELRYHQLDDTPEGRYWPAAALDATPDEAVMLHYSLNRPVGAVRGVSDLAPVVVWLERYALWLEDRVRINRYKGAYLWHVSVDNPLPGQIEARRAQYSRPPRSGSIVITDSAEHWEAIQPRIDADAVEADGRAIRLMIAAGAGIPLHYLAEGDTATRATAREMGTATLRHFAHRQRQFAAIVEDVIRRAAQRAGLGEIEVQVSFESVLAQEDGTTTSAA